MRTRTRKIRNSLLFLFLCLCPISSFASEIYSILFHKGYSYTDAEGYVNKLSLTKSKIFIQPQKNNEYWVLYGKMTKEEADKTYISLLTQKCDWIQVVKLDNTNEYTPQSPHSRVTNSMHTKPTTSTTGRTYLPTTQAQEEKPLYDRVIAYPEAVTNTIISSTYINRVIAPWGRKIKDIVIEKNSGVQVQIEGRNAFVTFLKTKDPYTKEILYTDKPVSIYIVVEPDIVYTIIASPKQVSSKTIELKYDNEKIAKNLNLFKGMPLEKKVINLVKSVMTNTIPDSFTRKKVGKELTIFKDLELYHSGDVIVEGEGLILKEFIVALNRRDDSIRLNEKQFLIPELTQAPLGIALEDFTLNRKTTKTRLFIVERGGSK